MGSDQHIKDVNMMEISVLIKVIKGERNLAEIARSLDITLQGVRYYINILRQDGYLLDLDITSKGYEFLSSSLFQIKKFLNDNSDFLSDANGWEVICDDDIKSGDIVYLRMADAYLHASKEIVSSSKARSVSDSSRGQRAIIGEIQGIIEINFGKVEVLLIKDLDSNNYEKYMKEIKDVKKNLNDRSIFVLGEGARTLFEDGDGINVFSPLRGAFDSAVRGMDSLVISTEEAFNLNFEEFSKLKEEFTKVDVTLNFLQI